ncbi:MAG: 3-isopropylmalate dehydratase small subunit, partial [candidate division WOR-3 bacterium]|nr:3-isopropylmalate dehydratase small subunit [candidate division WOR-3 bacterium]
MEPVKGKVWIFPDDVNTDVIYPGRYMSVTDAEETPKYLFETVYPDFRQKAKPGDVIVAGKYFGCGSSREQAATAIRYFGISCVIAESFARIFFRNAINLGLPIAVVPDISKHVSEGDEIEVDLARGTLKNLTTGKGISFEPLPRFILDLINQGGLIPAT